MQLQNCRERDIIAVINDGIKNRELVLWEVWSMGRKIVCESCGTEFKFEIAKNFEYCPACGASFGEADTTIQKEKKTFYIL